MLVLTYLAASHPLTVLVQCNHHLVACPAKFQAPIQGLCSNLPYLKLSLELCLLFTTLLAQTSTQQLPSIQLTTTHQNQPKVAPTWELEGLPEWFQGFPLWSKTRTQTICLFESNSGTKISGKQVALFTIVKKYWSIAWNEELKS